MTYEYCTVAREGRLTIVTINRPEAMNALHMEAHLEMEGIFDAFAADPDQWVAIVTGAGDRAFCAGRDLKAGAKTGLRGSPDGPRLRTWSFRPRASTSAG